jgi:hypothetical protein
MMEEQTLDAINARFNEDIQRQVDGTLPAGHVYRLGVPGEILQSTGFPNLPIELNADILLRKATVYGHDFSLLEIVDLPKLIQNPLAVFAYGDKKKAQNILIEVESKNGKKFLVGISLNPKISGKNIEVNSVRNVFPKDTHEWVNWIGQGKGLYYDKEKVLKILDQQRINPADVAFGFPEKNQVQQEKSKLSEFVLNPATKVVQNFQNPKLPEEEVKKNIKKAVPSAELKQALDKVESMKSKETTKNQINNMKNTLTIALLLASAACGAQTHFPKNYNVDLGGGVNDAGNYTPVAAVGYTFNNVESSVPRKEYEGR